jgi:hypothetical protein
MFLIYFFHLIIYLLARHLLNTCLDGQFLWNAAIQMSEHFVYIENQFFITS